MMDTYLNEPINQNSMKVSKVVKQRIRKRYLKTLGTSVINNQTKYFDDNKNYISNPPYFISLQ